MTPRPTVRAHALLAVACFALAACTTVPVPPLPEGALPSRADAPFDHAAFDRFLRTHVDSAGRVDYAAAARDRGGLDAYVARLAAVSPTTRPRASRPGRIAWPTGSTPTTRGRSTPSSITTRSIRCNP